MTTQLRTDRVGATLVFTLESPDARPQLTPAVCVAGVEAFNMAESNTEVRSIVITGASTCFGRDADPVRSVSDTAHAEALARWIETLRANPKPIVAAVNGTAAGLACLLAWACDLSVAAHDSRFQGPAPGGTPVHGGAAHVLASALPPALALEWLWLAPAFTAPQLHALGVVNALSGPGQAVATALSLCEQLNGLPPAALAAGKELVNRAPGQSLAAHLALERGRPGSPPSPALPFEQGIA